MKLLLLLAFLSVAAAAEINTASLCARWIQIGNDELEISCPPAQTVEITKAFFGYWASRSGSQQCSFTQDDCTEDAMRIAVAQCHGKTRCSIPVENNVVAHTLSYVLGINDKCGKWHDRHDYMEVSYQCTPVPRGANIVASECTRLHTVNDAPHDRLDGLVEPLNHHLQLDCPPQHEISIQDQFYGWWKDNKDQGCRHHQGDCTVPTTSASVCNGLTHCEIPIERSSTTSGCGGFYLMQFQMDRHDYIQVKYKCLQTRK